MHDHRLTWEEFQSLTLAQLEALEERRNVGIRHARFNAALVTATLYNAHRGPDSDPLEVWDFLPGYDKDPEEIEKEKARRAVVHAVKVAFSELPAMTEESVRAEKQKMIARMRSNGVEDPEGIMHDAFPDL